MQIAATIKQNLIVIQKNCCKIWLCILSWVKFMISPFHSQTLQLFSLISNIILFFPFSHFPPKCKAFFVVVQPLSKHLLNSVYDPHLQAIKNVRFTFKSNPNTLDQQQITKKRLNWDILCGLNVHLRPITHCTFFSQIFGFSSHFLIKLSTVKMMRKPEKYFCQPR